MRRFAAYIVMAIPLLLAACSNPKDTVIPANMDDWESKLKPVVSKLNEEDRKLLTAYMMRHMVGSIFAGTASALQGKLPDMSGAGIPAGTTIGQAITEQKNWQADQANKEAKAAALKKEAEAKAAAARKQMDNVISVALVSKTFEASDYQRHSYRDVQHITVAIKNTGSKIIAGVSGELIFTDIFGEDVGSIAFKVAETINPGEIYTWHGARDYNEFIKEHRAIRNLEEGKYKTRFEPDAIVFDDGTSLKAAE